MLWRCETHGGTSCARKSKHTHARSTAATSSVIPKPPASLRRVCVCWVLPVRRMCEFLPYTCMYVCIYIYMCIEFWPSTLMPCHRLHRNHQHHWGRCVCAECYRYVGCANFFHIHIRMHVYVYMCTEFWHPIERVLPVCGECEFLSYTCMYIRIYIYTCVLNSDSLLIECYQCAGCANFFHVHVYIYVYIHTCV